MEIILKNVNIDLENKKTTITCSADGLERRTVIEDKHKIQTDDKVTQEATTDFSDIFNEDSFQESAKRIVEYLSKALAE